MTSPKFHRRKDTMAFDHDDHENGVSRRRALKRMYRRPRIRHVGGRLTKGHGQAKTPAHGAPL
jgi:hypothetical protein